MMGARSARRAPDHEPVESASRRPAPQPRQHRRRLVGAPLRAVAQILAHQQPRRKLLVLFGSLSAQAEGTSTVCAGGGCARRSRGAPCIARPRRRRRSDVGGAATQRVTQRRERRRRRHHTASVARARLTAATPSLRPKIALRRARLKMLLAASVAFRPRPTPPARHRTTRRRSFDEPLSMTRPRPNDKYEDEQVALPATPRESSQTPPPPLGAGRRGVERRARRRPPQHDGARLGQPLEGEPVPARRRAPRDPIRRAAGGRLGGAGERESKKGAHNIQAPGFGSVCR